MNVFTTLLIDSFRMLRARSLFWVTLWISAFAALLYLSIGFSPEGFTLLFGLTEIKSELFRAGGLYSEILYLWIFSRVIVGLWLSWVAVALALVSCASIFPDFMSEGSIGIALSKPASRLTLFLSKYVGSLLFVIVQVSLFCAIVFLAVRWRLGTWNPTIFWAVPLVTLVFSYLYAVVVLVAVKSRSVLAAVLAGMVIWFTAWLGQWAESMLYAAAEEERSASSGAIEELQVGKWHRMSVVAMGFLPKTGQTMDLMDRMMVVGGKKGLSHEMLLTTMLGNDAKGIDKAHTRHSTAYILGTSLAFEAVILIFAAWSFCRRDY